MSSARLGRWLLLSWTAEEPDAGRRVELDEPHDLARLLRHAVHIEGAMSLRAFVHQLEIGAPIGLEDEQLIEHLVSSITRRRVRLFDMARPPMASDPVPLTEHVVAPVHHENIIDEVEFIEWTVEIDAEESVWFETELAPDELPQLAAELEQDELPDFTTETAVVKSERA